MRVGEPDDRVLAETAEGLREPEVGRSGEGGSSPGMGTRVRSPSTTKARGPGETTRRHGPRHVRARASDEARGSAPGSVTGQSGWKSGSRACAGAPAPVPGEDHSDMRLPRRVRRRADQRGREEGRRDTAPVRAEARPARYLGTADIARGSRARRCQLRCGPVSPPARAAPARGARPSRRTPPRRRRARPRICGGRPKRSTSRIGPVHASCPVELRRGSGGGDGRDRRASVADVVSPGSFRRGFTGCSGVSVQGRRVT